jgi:hypothetical protein
MDGAVSADFEPAPDAAEAIAGEAHDVQAHLVQFEPLVPIRSDFFALRAVGR